MTEQQAAVRGATLRVVLDRSSVNVRDVMDFTLALDTVAACVSVGMFESGRFSPEKASMVSDPSSPYGLIWLPRLVSVRNESPVTTVLQSLDMPAALFFLGYLLKNPAAVRTLLSRYRIDRDVALAREEVVRNWRNQVRRTDWDADHEPPELPDWIKSTDR